MSAVMVGVFDSFADAESVRAELVRGGFPAGRVELTTGRQKKASQLQSFSAAQGKIRLYFKGLFDQEDERLFVEQLAERVLGGRVATVAVHFREDIETSRATEIFENQGAIQVVQRDLNSQASDSDLYVGANSWLEYLLPEYDGAAGRFYLRSLPIATSET